MSRRSCLAAGGARARPIASTPALPDALSSAPGAAAVGPWRLTESRCAVTTTSPALRPPRAVSNQVAGRPPAQGHVLGVGCVAEVGQPALGPFEGAEELGAGRVPRAQAGQRAEVFLERRAGHLGDRDANLLHRGSRVPRAGGPLVEHHRVRGKGADGVAGRVESVGERGRIGIRIDHQVAALVHDHRNVGMVLLEEAGNLGDQVQVPLRNEQAACGPRRRAVGEEFSCPGGGGPHHKHVAEPRPLRLRGRHPVHDRVRRVRGNVQDNRLHRFAVLDERLHQRNEFGQRFHLAVRLPGSAHMHGRQTKTAGGQHVVEVLGDEQDVAEVQAGRTFEAAARKIASSGLNTPTSVDKVTRSATGSKNGRMPRSSSSV